MCESEHTQFTMMKNWNVWKTKMEEQNKMDEKSNGWKIQMDEHNLFATKGYVPM